MVTVYPRACGGTGSGVCNLAMAGGLSPRVRGNLAGHGLAVNRHRSIPARAGEPAPAAPAARPGTVYPRACGGTYYARVEHHTDIGLSPRVRGNRSLRCPRYPRAGSIPARAGEPIDVSPPIIVIPVYPRACGGTYYARVEHHTDTGLSPRVRGNRWIAAVGSLPFGSIPARAGEPGRPPPRRRPGRVYPRACGGTVVLGAYVHKYYGLSPRVRGNHVAASILPLE